METQGKPTDSQIATSGRGQDLATITKLEMLSPQQLSWVDFCVVQGLITMEDGSYKKMSVQKFASEINVNPQTLYAWRNGIPGFWDFVAQRRPEIFSKTRVQKVYNALFLKANTGDVRAIQTFLANADPAFRMPAQKVEIEAGKSWTELMSMYDESNDVIEGEVVADANDKS